MKSADFAVPVPLTPVQCDETCSFIGAKAKNVPEEKENKWGDCWTWTALDADTKLMISFRLGDRTLATAYDFMHDLADSLANRVQLTTDGHKVYLEAVESASKKDIDYAMLHKVYRSNPEGETLQPRHMRRLHDADHRGES